MRSARWMREIASSSCDCSMSSSARTSSAGRESGTCSSIRAVRIIEPPASPTSAERKSVSLRSVAIWIEISSYDRNFDPASRTLPESIPEQTSRRVLANSDSLSAFLSRRWAIFKRRDACPAIIASSFLRSPSKTTKSSNVRPAHRVTRLASPNGGRRLLIAEK